MIINRSTLNVADNSGAQIVMCIGVLKKSGCLRARVGDIIKCVVKKANPSAKIKDGDVVNAVIVRTKYDISRNDGCVFRFDDNAVVILDNQMQMVGTRIFGPVSSAMRLCKKVTNVSKILSLSEEIL